MLRIYAPASSANISVGFDTLGAAISPIDGSLLGDVVQIESIPSVLNSKVRVILCVNCQKNRKKISCIKPMCCLVSN